MEENMTTCIYCDHEKLSVEFRDPKTKKGGRLNICFACVSSTPLGSKICSKCAKLKNLSEYHPHTKTVDGKQPSCKDCCYKVKLRSQEKYPEKHRERMRTIVRRAHVRRKYKLVRGEYEFLVEKTGNTCEACGNPETITHKDGSIWELCVDHDHVTGKVRGLLCHACNRAAGAINDDPARLRQIADYLEERRLL
jgi:hypothetical protein